MSVTFGIATSCFASNTSVLEDLAEEFPLATRAVCKGFYIDNGISGADDTAITIAQHNQLQVELDFNSANGTPANLMFFIPLELREYIPIRVISGRDH